MYHHNQKSSSMQPKHSLSCDFADLHNLTNFRLLQDCNADLRLVHVGTQLKLRRGGKRALVDASPTGTSTWSTPKRLKIDDCAGQ